MFSFKKNIFLLILLILFGFIFFFRLDYKPLESWDEAWYGSIANDVVKTGNFMDTTYNNKPYFDHPPAGFVLMAASYKLLGVSEFSTRLPSVLFGLMSILLIYLIASELFGRSEIAFASALILGSSVWYVIRVRSGNLDSAFLFFYLLTVYLSLKSARNFRWFPFVGLSFGALIMTKTLAGISVLVLIVLLNIKTLFGKRENLIWLLLAFIFFYLLVFPWYKSHEAKYSDFLNYQIKHIGQRDRTQLLLIPSNISQTLFYLHMGIRKWFKLWQLSFIPYLFLFLYQIYSYFKRGKKIKQKKSVEILPYLFILIWTTVVLYPFLASSQTEIWHLIPVYPPIALFIASVTFNIGLLFVKTVVTRFNLEKVNLVRIYPVIFIGAFLVLSFIQAKNFWAEVYPKVKYTNDEVDISRRLSKYNQMIYVDGDYLPLAVFYSGKQIKSLILESDSVVTFTKLFEIDKGNVIGVTRNWVFDDLRKKNFNFKLLEKNNSYSIVTIP
ncbi:hypothetical protein A2866_04905 [Candidatus Roizmanbacteria bacterium RIFCSPHIGHO2_01_FULL_39_8]|uniref:Glycosyltransferase RgtA/B/C/D-like domain-containing protein n=2 Tax=Candidatus Roizmaniibacteriota TaxID=1752723 RepID=A0A1F7GQN6_9BACT|nr:MAG: hypothetical protein A2866_04905 [Candidatus Roizmanbacteria bacterium RIFCSPHIGHO2_01_FULL_39_8]